MSRRRPKGELQFGSDSFLDVVTNIVGILIILVMLVGGRAKKVMMDAMPARGERVASLEPEGLVLDQTVAGAESEVAELAAQGRTVATAAAGAGDSGGVGAAAGGEAAGTGGSGPEELAGPPGVVPDSEDRSTK